MVKWNGPFRSDRSNREKWPTSKGGPIFSKLFRLDRTDPFSFRPKFPEILVELIAPTASWVKANSFPGFFQHSNPRWRLVPGMLEFHTETRLLLHNLEAYRSLEIKVLRNYLQEHMVIPRSFIPLAINFYCEKD